MKQNDLQLIPAVPLRKLLGGVSDMTLYRWMAAGTFPRPVVGGVKGHRYWRMIDIAAWQQTNIQKSCPVTQEHKKVTYPRAEAGVVETLGDANAPNKNDRGAS